MSKPIRVLYVDDYPLDRELVLDALEKETGGFQVTLAASRAEFEAALNRNDFDLVLSDFNILGFEGLQVIDAVHAKNPNLPVVIVTGTGSEEVAVEAMKRGAADYVIKSPKHIQRLPLTIQAVLRRLHLEEERQRNEATQKNFYDILNASQNEIYIFDAETLCFEFVSAGALQNLGYTLEQMRAMTPLDLKPAFTWLTFQELVEPLRRHQSTVIRFETFHRRADASTYPVEVHLQLFDQIEHPVFLAVILDLTERKRAESKQRQLTRLYVTLSQINQTIVRVKDPLELYRAICQIAVQYGEFALAWIGLLDGATGAVTPVAYAGQDAEYVANLNINVNDPVRGRGPTGMALRTGKLTTSDNIQTNHAMAPWRAQAEARNFRASASVPFRLQGTVVGALNLYVREPFFFSDPEETRLLEEIGLDISFALDAIQIEAERQRVEQALRESEARWQFALEGAGDGVWDWDAQTNQVYFSRQWKAMLGYAEHEIGNTLAEWEQRVHPDDLASVMVVLRQHLDGVTPVYVSEHRLRCKDGTYKWILDRGKVIERDANGAPRRVVGTHTDITERKRAEEQIAHLARFPEENPNPVLRVDQNGLLLYANAASQPVLAEWQCEVGTQLPPEWRQLVLEAMETRTKQARDLVCGDRVISFLIVPIGAAGYVNLYGRDITDRVRAEETLRASERHFRSLFENMLEGFAYCRMLYENNLPQDFVCLEVNAAFESLTGLKEVVGKRVTQVIPGIRESNPELFEIYGRVAKTGKPEQFETFLPALDIWFSVSVYSPQPEYFVSVFDNITQRKRAEQALRESEANLRESQRVAHVGHWAWDTQTNRVTWSDEMKRIFGLDPETFAGDLNEIVARAIHPDDQAAVNAANQAVLTEQKPAPMEYRIVLPDQSVRVIWAVPGDKVVDADGKILKLTGIVQDITERKQAELKQQELARERDQYYQRLQLILDRMPIACVMNDVDFKIVYWNRAAETIFGFSAAEMLGQSPYDTFIPRGAKPYVEELRQKMVRENIATVGQNENRTKDGRTIFCEWHNVLLRDANGQLIGFLGMAQDVTARKQAEEQIQRQVQYLDALRSIDVAISSNFNLNITLDILLKRVVEQLRADAAAVLLFNPNLLTLNFAAGVGFRTPAIQRVQLRLGEGVAGKIALERRAIQLTNLTDTDQRFWARIGLLVEQFQAYYGVPLIAKGQIKGVLEIFHRTPLEPTAEWVNFLEMLAGQAAIAIDNVQLFESLERSNLDLALAYDATIEGWSRALDLRDRETEGHTQRVVDLTLQIAQTLIHHPHDLVHIRRGALLHDIGKLGVPDAILLKPGKLTEDEWAIVRQHPTFAYDMLSPIAYLRPALDIPYCHHEKWDGTGYPRGLAGEQIPLAARIFAVVDVWDALRSDRPYRRGWPDDQVYAYLRAESGAHFDPQIVDLFFRTIARAPKG